MKVYKNSDITQLRRQAELRTRRRLNLNIHEDFDDPIQKFFNAICKDSYIRPHRHNDENGEELLIAIEGVFGIFTFDAFGDVVDVIMCSSDKSDVERNRLAVVPPYVWHTVLAISDDCVILEVKKGPYSQESAKEFASWSPEPDTHEASVYIQKLQKVGKKITHMD